LPPDGRLFPKQISRRRRPDHERNNQINDFYISLFLKSWIDSNASFSLVWSRGRWSPFYQLVAVYRWCCNSRHFASSLRQVLIES